MQCYRLDYYSVLNPKHCCRCLPVPTTFIQAYKTSTINDALLRQLWSRWQLCLSLVLLLDQTRNHSCCYWTFNCSNYNFSTDRAIVRCFRVISRLIILGMLSTCIVCSPSACSLYSSRSLNVRCCSLAMSWLSKELLGLEIGQSLVWCVSACVCVTFPFQLLCKQWYPRPAATCELQE
jgi:hypothetical protein